MDTATTLEFRKNINRNVLATALKPTGETWDFDNGQYGEKIQCKEGYEFYLSYHYDLVFLNYCRYNDSGWRSGGSQRPLSTINQSEWIDYAKQIFEADKKLGIINQEYRFS